MRRLRRFSIALLCGAISLFSFGKIVTQSVFCLPALRESHSFTVKPQTPLKDVSDLYNKAATQLEIELRKKRKDKVLVLADTLNTASRTELQEDWKNVKKTYPRGGIREVYYWREKFLTEQYARAGIPVLPATFHDETLSVNKSLVMGFPLRLLEPRATNSTVLNHVFSELHTKLADEDRYRLLEEGRKLLNEIRAFEKSEAFKEAVKKSSFENIRAKTKKKYSDIDLEQIDESGFTDNVLVVFEDNEFRLVLIDP